MSDRVRCFTVGGAVHGRSGTFGVERKAEQFAKLDQTLQARSFSSQTLQIDELIDEPFGIDTRLARNSVAFDGLATRLNSCYRMKSRF
jgi:hypothetical protein